MLEKVQLRRTVVDREKYLKVVDTSFSSFPETVGEEQITLEQFFQAYENLYYEIPVEGVVNSHEYLVRRSSELLDLEKNTEDIQRFLDEIARLREQLLEANQTILQLRIDNPVNSING